MLERFAGRFLLLRRLGRGGMGEVFLARDLTTGTECALKRLSPREPAGLPEAARREFEALTRVRHPALVSMREFGVSPEGVPYCVMEYAPGVAADRAIARGDWPALCDVGARVARGLEALHAAGVVHGDIKPANLLVTPGESPGDPPREARLLDFGLSVLAGRPQGGHTGTAGFAAPEVVRGESPSPASDLYGLGATLYALGSGRPPFDGDDVDSMLRRQQAGPPSALPLEEAGAPETLVGLVLRFLSPDPSERPASAREARRELERIHPEARRPLAEQIRSVVVVGRERELGRVEAWMGRAPGEVPMLLVGGDPGTGKSALLAELGVRAALAGRVTISLSCGAFEGTGSVAVAIANRLAAEVGEGVSSRSAPGRGSPARTRETLGDQDLDSWVTAGAGRAEKIAERAGAIVVLLDDAERLDALSLAWIRRLACRDQPVPIRWILARRPASGGEPEDEAVLVEAGYAQRLELRPLDRDAVSRLADARLGDRAPDEIVEFLWAEAAGHPGLTVELLRAAAERGAVVEDDAGLRVDIAALAAVGVPEDFETGLVARFEALPPEARALAEALAVWGRGLDLAGIHALAPGADADAATALRSAGLARIVEDGALLIWPPAIGERLARSIPEERRRALHRSAQSLPGLGSSERFRHLRGAGDAAGALAAAHSALEESADEKLAVAAVELAETEAPGVAAAWHERVARLLMARRRYAAAVPHAQRALDLEREGPARGGRWMALCTCTLNAGRLAETARVVEQALEEGVAPDLRACLMADDAARLSLEGRLEEALAASERAAVEAKAAGSDLALAVAAELIAQIQFLRGRIDPAAAASRQAREAYDRAGNFVGHVRLMVLDAGIARARQGLGESLRLHEEALASARGRGDRLGVEFALDRQGLALSEAGRWREATEAYREVFRIAVEDGRAAGAAIALANLGYMAGMMGDARQARRLAKRALAPVKRHQPRVEGFVWRSRAQALRITGRLQGAERAARTGLRMADRVEAGEFDWCRVELGRVLAARGRWPEARAVWDSLPHVLERESGMGAAIRAIFSGRAALRAGEVEVAGRRLEAAEAWLATHTSPHAAAFATLLRAELALAQGRAPLAIQEAGKALDAFAALPAPADRAIAAYDLARLASDAPELEPRAVEWLDIAAAGFQRLGDRRGRERALTLLVERLRRGAARAPGGGDRGLIEQVSWLLGSISDLRELAQRAMRMAVEQLDAERGVLLLLDPETGQLSVMAEHGSVDSATRSEAVGYSRRVVGRVTESGGSLLISDAPSDPRLRSDSVVNLQLRSILCVPLFFGGRVVGAVYLDDSRRAHRFDDQDRGLLEGFAHLMAVAIEKARGHEEIERMKRLLEDENLSLRQEVGNRFQYQNVVGASSQIKRVLATIEHAARTNTTVLLSGENGTGKELVARTLHHAGKRGRGPFVVVNCGAIPEALLESELFGILSNVATGVRAREGRFVQANGGTLFLDEVGEMPLKQQVALLSAIAIREITPVGGGRPIPVDVRIVAASNRDLRKMVEQGLFREDLYYRLNVLDIEVPPLRERKSDIPALAKHFLERFAAAQEREVPQLSPDFMAVLMQSDWPGNVRELQNYIERVLAMNPGPLLQPDPLPRDLQERGTLKPGRGRRLADTVGDIERRMLVEALRRADGNQSQAARLLGLTEQSIRYRIRKYGMRRERGIRRTRKN